MKLYLRSCEKNSNYFISRMDCLNKSCSSKEEINGLPFCLREENYPDVRFQRKDTLILIKQVKIRYSNCFIPVNDQSIILISLVAIFFCIRYIYEAFTHREESNVNTNVKNINELVADPSSFPIIEDT